MLAENICAEVFPLIFYLPNIMAVNIHRKDNILPKGRRNLFARKMTIYDDLFSTKNILINIL